MKLFSRKNKIAGLVGGAIGAVGIAAAATLLVATITGSTTLKDVQVGASIESVTNLAGTNGVACNAAKTGGNGLQVNASAERLVVAGQPAETRVGKCSFEVVLKNTGSTPLGFAAAGLKLTEKPSGWSAVINPNSGSIPANGVAKATVELSASSAAQAGQFRGVLEASAS